MNIPTIIAFLVVAILFALAALYLYKNGTCGGCPDHGSCSGHCDSKKRLKVFKSSPDYKEKNDMIDEIIKKHKKI